ncbi:hypothetical protein ACW5UC_25275 [Priestia aryabhattai]|uniref:hypothetical protein n=1 Tax=Priestia megaterium TaxID=1404 RepID=UPI003F95B7BE
MVMNMSTKEELREIIRRSEVKRISERITKRELCKICGISYTFYVNCINNNKPSLQMGQELQKYLDMPVAEVYDKVFKSREAETKFHKELNVTKEYMDEQFSKLKGTGSYNLTEEEYDVLVQSAFDQKEEHRIEREKKLEEARALLEEEAKRQAQEEGQE